MSLILTFILALLAIADRCEIQAAILAAQNKPPVLSIPGGEEPRWSGVRVVDKPRRVNHAD